jgi:hypothetical protein
LNVAQGKQKNSTFQISLTILYIISLSIFLYFLFKGFHFYTESNSMRPRLAEYRILRPAGNYGHTFGVIGTIMMLLMLLYSVRKRTGLFSNLFHIRYWLQIHIFFGILGPLFIVLHTSFIVSGLVAVSFWSMVAVALSGVLGRYLYLQIPRTISGGEIGLKDLEESDRELSLELNQDYNMDEKSISEIARVYLGKIPENRGTLYTLITLIGMDLIRPLRFFRLKKQLLTQYDLPKDKADQMIQLIRRKALIHRRIMLLDKIQQLFHYWHVVHKPFAFIMYLILFVHVLVAILMGYTWLF